MMETQKALPRADLLGKALRWEPRLVQKMAERRVAMMVGRMAFWTAGCWVLPMAEWRGLALRWAVMKASPKR